MRRTLRIAPIALVVIALPALISQGQRSILGHRIKPLNEARAGAGTALLPDGRVLVTGGDGASGPLASAEYLGAVGNLPAMRTPRSAHITVALKDGRVLVAGGRTTGSSATDSAEIFDPETSAWTPVASMQYARIGAVATLLRDGSVLIAGGDSGAGPLASLER